VVYQTYSISGWAGDHAGSVVGRKPNTLLISVNASVEGGFGSTTMMPSGLYLKQDLGGVPWYPKCAVQCLTPNALGAFATKITSINGWGYVYAIEVRPIDWGRGGDPWVAGVHLFSVILGDYPSNGGVIQASTIATAVISDRISPYAPELEVIGPTLWNMAHEDLRGRPIEERPDSMAPPDAGADPIRDRGDRKAK